MSQTIYQVFAEKESGGKRVAVFTDAQGDLQARAAQSGAPLSVFVESTNLSEVVLKVFTPIKEKGSSDSAAVVALAHLRPQLLDVAEVQMGGEILPAQLCGGEWLLRQGVPAVREVEADLSPIGMNAERVWTASLGRPNLVVEVNDLAALDAFTPNAEAIATVNRATHTTGLILFTPGGPGRADLSLRAFGPLKGFTEDAASSNMLACAVGVLGASGRLPADTNLLRAAQRMPGQPARLSVQFGEIKGGFEVWVGGAAIPDQ
ncbi:PhzF family phenazine biosynthesis protein [Deinococcus arenicola]|uniref:PhzF family phenazine biosynthesis protein n=1 Tax=Deinococcus arenicola TaxID=2994950 RepID=A0ABU4DQE1_9DEIO|nr:PhzF family phenazine biosynthesis protein [Deinococcus sp. ZS9-10]MDV6373924.1 PhzF family phenazine biosynthesis protein [Deinococcus sp. ZS9-10]